VKAVNAERPAVLGAERVALSSEPCHCFCGARHRERMGVCEGTRLGPRVRVYLNSIWSTGSGVLICLPCAAAWPEELTQ
jgi:hypothetical protein